MNGSDKTFFQLIRFGIVGVMNTLITLAVIFLLKNCMHCNEWWSNAAGYIAGFINSFIWSKMWVFHSHKKVLPETLKFICGFGICYTIQLATVWGLYNFTSLKTLTFSMVGYSFTGYGVATLIGMCVYTICNFIYNRTVTFK